VNRAELIKRFPNASDAFLRSNADPTAGSLPHPIPEHRVQENPLVEDKGKEASPSRCPVRLTIISRRVRLIDPDNFTTKFLIDALRHEKLIADDSPEHIVLEVRQEKVQHRSQEETIVAIDPQNYRRPNPDTGTSPAGLR